MSNDHSGQPAAPTAGQTPDHGKPVVIGSGGGFGSVAIAAVQLSRVTPLPGGGGYTSTHTMTLHHRAGLNEDEMRGVAVVEALKIKPGFSIDEVLVTIVSLPNAGGQTCGASASEQKDGTKPHCL